MTGIPLRHRTMMARLLLVFALIMALASCVSVPRTRPADAPMLAAQTQREATLSLQNRWQMQGRIALALGDDSGSGRLLWQHDGADFSIQVSAPVSRQSWRLSTREGWARLDGLDDGPHEGANAQTLLRESLGWDVPLSALSAWLRGMRASGPATVQFDQRGLPAQITQQGWLVEFRAWSTDTALPMPRRVFASRGDAKVRLVIDRWGPLSKPTARPDCCVARCSESSCTSTYTAVPAPHMDVQVSREAGCRKRPLRAPCTRAARDGFKRSPKLSVGQPATVQP